MKSFEELQLELAKFMHEYWKEFTRPLLLGKHIDDLKREQYSRGMCTWKLLEDKYKKVYLIDANSILNMCSRNIPTLADHYFNGEDE